MRIPVVGSAVVLVLVLNQSAIIDALGPKYSVLSESRQLEP